MADAPNGRVLVVDDDRDNAVSLGRLLRANGYEAQWCFNAVDCLDIVSSWYPDAVLLDLVMPGITGYEIAATLRHRLELQSLALIALSGYVSEAERLKPEAVGFDWYLVKPVTWQELNSVLKAAINGRAKH
jgi:CheY-like chemotaxis protein